MAEYGSLLSDLSENITNEDLEQLKSACKEDIPEDQSNSITSSKEWFSYLEKNDKLAHGERDEASEPLVWFGLNSPSNDAALRSALSNWTPVSPVQITCRTSSTSLRFRGDPTC